MGIGEEGYDHRLGAGRLWGDDVPDARDADDGCVRRLAAAASAPASDVNVSKLPEMRSVGMLLATGWCMASGAAGLFQTSRQSSLKYPQPPTPWSRIDAG